MALSINFESWEWLRHLPLNQPFFRSGELRPIYGVNMYAFPSVRRWFECVDCRTSYPEMLVGNDYVIRCNGLPVTRCPYCRPELLGVFGHYHMFGRPPDLELKLKSDDQQRRTPASPPHVPVP